MYEVARAIERRGLPAPARLFVSSQPGPQEELTGRVIGMTEPQLAEEPARTGWAVCGDTEFVVLPGVHHRFVDALAELLEALASAVQR